MRHMAPCAFPPHPCNPTQSVFNTLHFHPHCAECGYLYSSWIVFLPPEVSGVWGLHGPCFALISAEAHVNQAGGVFRGRCLDWHEKNPWQCVCSPSLAGGHSGIIFTLLITTIIRLKICLVRLHSTSHQHMHKVAYCHALLLLIIRFQDQRNANRSFVLLSLDKGQSLWTDYNCFIGHVLQSVCVSISLEIINSHWLAIQTLIP